MRLSDSRAKNIYSVVYIIYFLVTGMV